MKTQRVETEQEGRTVISDFHRLKKDSTIVLMTQNREIKVIMARAGLAFHKDLLHKLLTALYKYAEERFTNQTRQ